jgi:hypothetical protein
MSFIHDDPEFDALLRIVARNRRLSPGLVEKDYWVTHALWALHARGFEILFKGGTSLSKGFGLIERFSEDLDLKIEPGAGPAMAAVSDWKRTTASATAVRRAYFEALADALTIPGAQTSLDPDSVDKHWRNASIRVAYPGKHLAELNPILKPFVVLEIGNARVTPSVLCDISSFVHDELVAQEQIDTFDDNRPKQVRCVHPLVTLLEKLDSLARRVPSDSAHPSSFVRHYEDAARIIASEADLPPLAGYEGPRQLAADLLRQRQIAPPPGRDHPAFALPPGTRTDAIRSAYAAIGPMFWGPRRTLDECAAEIRAWIRRAELTG